MRLNLISLPIAKVVLSTLIIIVVSFFNSSYGLNPGDVTITKSTGPYFTTDSNNPCTDGPRAAYIGFIVTNTSGATLNNLSISIGSFLPAGFSLAGGQASSIVIGTLAAGAFDKVYFYVTYPCVDNTTCSVTATVSNGVPGVVTYTATTTTKSTISANAGGLINASLWGTGAVVGQILSFDITYAFGNANVGDEYVFQPAGNLSFDAGTFQLVNAQIISSVIPGITAGTKDSLFFIGGLKNGSSNLVTMRYYFQIMKSNSPGTSARPYSSQTSGNQVKYTGNYVTVFVNSSPPSGTFPFTTTLTASKSNANSCDTVNYVVTISNTSAFTTNFDKIKVCLPSYMSFIGILPASQITTTMLTTYPAAGATGCIEWVGGGAASVFPYKELYLPANSSLTLQFNAKVSCAAPSNTTSNASALSYGGTDSSNVSNQSICYNCSYNVSGNVYNDVNGLTNSLVDGTGTNAGGINAILVNSSGNVIATTAVAAGGTYSFSGVYAGSYTILISTTAGTVGAAAPAVALPSGWVNTGEGTAAGGDGTVNGVTAITVSTANITGVNFGIEQLPTASALTASSQVNPGGTTNVTVPATTFGATDPSSGTISSIRISSFPTNATSITINGTTYTSGTFPGGGVTVPTNSSGQPTQTITIDPTDGAVTSVITYYATDNAGKESSSTGTASVPFTTASVSGNVYNDVNGLTNSLVDGSGTNAGGTLYASLVNGSNTVVATTAVAAGGTYSFSGVNGGSYTVVLHTTAGGSNAAALPSGWVNTGEGTAAGGDGTVNGVTAITVSTANISSVNFGIEQLPTASALTASSQVNPGGTTNVTVPATTFGATDPSSGTISSIRISSFPTNATSITINGTTYTSGTFPGGGVTVPTNSSGQPTQTITIDPTDGAVTSVITYYATDNAGKESSSTGTASVPFVCSIPGLWTGAINNDWHNPGNWCSLSIPVSTTDVVIPTGVTNMPSTSSAVVISSIDIQSGATVNISSDAFTFTGSITGTGTFTTNSTSVLTIGGVSGGNAGTVYFTSGSNTIGSLVIDRTGSSGAVTVGNTVNVISVVNPINGTINSNGNIVLVSSASGTARVAEINCASAGVIGDVTVQRYIPARRAWRLLTAPVTGSQTLHQAWQENADSSLHNPAPGYGTHITGGTAASGFDQTLTNNPSIRIYNQSSFSFTATPLSSTNLPINNEPGYFVFVRGSRSANLSTNTPSLSPTVLRSKGPLNSCTQSFPTFQGACTLVGNPYASAIDFTRLVRTNIPNRFFLWDPWLNVVGGYQTFDSSNNWVPVPGGGSYGNTPNTIIQQGQAFFVQGTLGSGSLIINENAKVSGSSISGFRPAAPLAPQTKITLKLNTINTDNTTTLNDGMLAVMDNEYAAVTDNDDARKMSNVDEMLCLIRESKLWAIERRPAIIAEDTLFLKAYNLKVKNYRFEIAPENFDTMLVRAWLEDNFLNTSTPINLSMPSMHDFIVTDNTASSNSSRFRIVFRPSVVLPVKFVSINANNNNGNVIVQWAVATSVNVIKYEVLRSTDGINFQTISSQLPLTSNSYSYFDPAASTGINYYRIRAVETSGAVYHSIIIKVKIYVQAPGITVYPNPITGRQFICSVNNLPNGVYDVTLHNSIGELIYTNKVIHTGGLLTMPINVQQTFTPGISLITVSNTRFSISQSIHHIKNK